MSESVARALEDYANEHGEPHWLVKRRLEALSQIESAAEMDFDIPTMQVPKKVKLTKEALSLAKIDEVENGLTQIGQSSLENTLDEEVEDDGVILTDIFTAFRQHPRLIESYFMNKVILESENKLTEFHTAVFNNGIFLYLPKNYQLTEDVYLNIIQNSLETQPLISHIFIYADQGSSATIISDMYSIGPISNYAEIEVEILARPNSQINYFSLEHFNDTSKVICTRRATVSREATVNWNVAQFDLGKSRGTTSSKLAHKTAQSNIQVYSLNQSNEIGINDNANNEDDFMADIVNFDNPNVIERVRNAVFNRYK
jgi:Fe-S cluster assembly scaffold protein SufB